jgi:hypothetical protein
MKRFISSRINFNLRATALALVIASASIGAAAATQGVNNDRAEIYRPGNQYTASYFQTTREWLLTPADGSETTVSAADLRCAGSAALPRGVWLLTRDSNGHAMLVAPSVTALAAGQSDQVLLVPCGGGKSAANTLNVPMALIDWLAATSGAVWIE